MNTPYGNSITTAEHTYQFNDVFAKEIYLMLMNQPNQEIGKKSKFMAQSYLEKF